MRVAALSRDLIVASRILAEATAAGHDGQLVSDPSALPLATSVDILFVNWADRTDAWAGSLTRWRDGAPPLARPRLILYGPHTDLEAHGAARAAGLGPMWARSKLLASLPTLVDSRDSGRRPTA